MKKIVLPITIVLAAVAIALVWQIVVTIKTPLDFDAEFNSRSKEVIAKLEKIRSAERMYKDKYGKFTDSFDSLEHFILNDSIKIESKQVDEDDSIKMALLKKSGQQNIKISYIMVRDTVFGSKTQLSEQDVHDLRYIPYNPEKKEFHLAAGQATTGSTMVLPTVECYALFSDFLDHNKYKQEIINLIDLSTKTDEKKIEIGVDANGNPVFSAGWKFGSMEANNNENGNWGSITVE